LEFLIHIGYLEIGFLPRISIYIAAVGAMFSPFIMSISINSYDYNLSGIDKLTLFCAALLYNPEDRAAMLDCHEERFEKDCLNHGYIWAKAILWWDISLGIKSALCPIIAKLFKISSLIVLLKKVFYYLFK
jgi:hypothetical protein